MEGESSLLTPNKRVMNIIKGPKQTTPQEMEPTPAGGDESPSKKRKTPSKPSTLEPADSFEATTVGAVREFSVLFSEFSEALSERAADDATKMKELDCILTEAKNLEAHLTEKKKLLKQTLDQISGKL
ncbi:uncharacterized protein tex12 [Epinephelus lanceolatus]